MNNDELIARIKQGDVLQPGDRVRIRAPREVENHSGWGDMWRERVGMEGVFLKGEGKSEYVNTCRVELDGGEQNMAIRTQWLERV